MPVIQKSKFINLNLLSWESSPVEFLARGFETFLEIALILCRLLANLLIVINFKLILCLCLLGYLAFKLRLLFLCDLKPLLVLEALVLGLYILTYLIRHGLSAFFCVKLI